MPRKMISKILAALLLLGVATVSAASAQTTYIAFGDSITEGFGDDDPTSTDIDKGYPTRLEDLLENAGQAADVENHGFGGERTIEAVTRIGPILSMARSGDVLLLMEGTNDISRNIGFETTVFNLDSMADRAERRGIKAVHATVIPRIPHAEEDADNVLTQQMNGLIRNLADIRGRDLADPFEVFLQEPGLFTRLYSNDPKDPVGHPNGAGYDVLAEVFFDVLTNVDSVPPVHGRMQPFNGQRGVQPGTSIDVDVLDFGLGIDLSATSLLINGEVVPATITGDSERVKLFYKPSQPMRGSISIGLRSRDLATPPNTVDREIARYRTSGTGAVLLDGDLTEDGRVDGNDLVTFARHFGASRGERRFEPRADFNEDGRINGQDLATLASNFGETSF
jgi:lysophospholipase L1-like esterase